MFKHFSGGKILLAVLLPWLLFEAMNSLGASCVSAPSGLIGWWPGDGSANDIAGSYNGSLQGGAIASAVGEVGSAFSFDGTNGYVQVPDAPALRPTNLTVEGWVLFNSLDSQGSSRAGQQFIVFKQNTRSSAFEGFNLSKDRRTGGDYLLFGVTSASGAAAEADSVSLVSTGVWYHVAGVRGPNYVQVYINGKLETQITANFQQDYGNFPMYFGTSGQPAWDHKLSGLLDEVSLYNRALSSNEIAAIYLAGAPGKCKNLSITSQPQDQAVAVGGTATFSVSASGSGSLGYQWQRGGINLSNVGNISGVDSSTLTLTNAQTGDSGSYQVIVTNFFSSVTSSPAALFVDTSLTSPAITNQPASLAVPAGTTATFNVGATGSPPLSYRWFYNGGAITNSARIAGATSPSLSIGFAFASDTGNYLVIVSNSLGSVTSTVATLTIIPNTNCLPPPSGLVGWWPGDGNAKDLVGTNNGILVGGASANAPGVDGLAFSLDGTNSYVQVPNAPELNPQTLSVECWVKFSSLDTPGTSTLGAQYIVFKQNTRTLTFEGYNLSKHRYANDIFVWESSSAGGVAVQINSLTTISTNVWYNVVGVRGSNYLALYVNGQLEVQTNIDFPQDYGNYPLYFGTSNESYWDHKLAGSLDEVSLYNRALSAAEISAIYSAGAAGKCQAPTILMPPQNQSIALGSNATFSVSASGIGVLKYLWSFNGTPVPGATNSSFSVTNAQFANAGTYSVMVSNTFGGVSASAFLAVTGARPQLIRAALDTNGVFSCYVRGDVGRVYAMESTTDFFTWFPAGAVTNTAAQTLYNDSGSSNSLSRFYRARLLY